MEVVRSANQKWVFWPSTNRERVILLSSFTSISFFISFVDWYNFGYFQFYLEGYAPRLIDLLRKFAKTGDIISQEHVNSLTLVSIRKGKNAVVNGNNDSSKDTLKLFVVHSKVAFSIV